MVTLTMYMNTTSVQDLLASTKKLIKIEISGEIKSARSTNFSEPTAAHMELISQEELIGNEIAHESSTLKPTQVDKLIQEQAKNHSSPQLTPALTRTLPVRDG